MLNIKICLPVNMCVCVPYVCLVPAGPETGVTDVVSCCVGAEKNPGLLEEQSVPFTDEPSF